MKLVHKILTRLRRKATHAAAYTRAQIFNTKPTEDKVLAAWHSSLPLNFDACLEEWLASRPRVFSVDRDFSSPIETICQEADRVVGGTTILLNHLCSLKRPTLWKEDPLTHQVWPTEIHFTRFNIFHPSHDGITDIRRLWEVGRFGWALPLAHAYTCTGRVVYAETWSDYVTDFIEHNPPEFGPHWFNAMEVAIRTIQWCRALALFLSIPHSTFQVPRSMLASLLAHGRYIRSHLEWTPYGRTNHYITNLVGLLTLAVFIPQFRKSKEWLHFANHALSHEIEVQTDLDGFHAEASTAYHHFALQLYTLAVEIDHEHKLRFSPRFVNRVLQMQITDALLRGSENLDPQIGDDDHGTLRLPESILRIPDWKAHTSHISQPTTRSKAWTSSIAFRSSGIYIMRSEAISCYISCGPNGQQGVGGHAHNDKLSVVIRLQEKPMIVDSGTYCYSADTRLRNRFRSTSIHNTITVDDQEQNPLKDWRKLHDSARARCLLWKDSPDETFFLGEHSGYQEIGVTHRRTLQLDKKHHRLTVLDELESKGLHTYDFYLHFAPFLTRVNVQVETQRVILPGADLIFRDTLPLELLDTTLSPVYGTQTANLTLHFQLKINGKWQLPWEFHKRS